MENGTGEEEEGGGGGEVAHSCFGRDPLHVLKTTARSGRRGAKTNTHSASTDLSKPPLPANGAEDADASPPPGEELPRGSAALEAF